MSRPEPSAPLQQDAGAGPQGVNVHSPDRALPEQAHWVSLSRSRARARRRFAAASLCAALLFGGYATARAEDTSSGPLRIADRQGVVQALDGLAGWID